MSLGVNHTMKRKIEKYLLQSPRKYAILAITVFCVITLAIVYLPIREKRSHPVYTGLTGGPIDLRRDLARDLRNVYHDLKRAKDYNKPPDTHSLLTLERTLGRLDPRLLPLSSAAVSHQKNLLLSENKSDALLEVCPEEYLGSAHDPPYHSEAFVAECEDKILFRNLVTFLIDTSYYSTYKMEVLLEAIVARYEGVTIIVTVSNSAGVKVAQSYGGVKIVRVTSSTPPSVRWMRMIRNVTTKYVLMGYNLVAFSPYTDVERLVRAFKMTPHAGYVSGATRNESGHWAVECFQGRLELYGLTLREGYTASTVECMYCDAVGGPFLTTVEALRETPLDERMVGDAVFVDWFLRMRANGFLGLVCPDVLFFVQSNRVDLWSSRKTWGVLAAKWGVTDVLLPLRHYHHFTCQEAKLSCDVPEDLALPPCCLAFLSRFLREVTLVLESKGVLFHLTDTTVTSGVKGGLQPWQKDIHLAVEESHGFQPAIEFLRRGGYIIDLAEHDKDTYVLFPPSSFSSSSYSSSSSSNVLSISLHRLSLNFEGDFPINQRNTPTVMRIAGAWLPSPPNPGLYARGYLGWGSLQHRPQGGAWPKCSDPAHHSCLDHLPIDGTWTRLR